MTYDEWKTTDPSDADYCENGHYQCPVRCSTCGGCVESCDCGPWLYEEPDEQPMEDTK